MRKKVFFLWFLLLAVLPLHEAYSAKIAEMHNRESVPEVTAITSLKDAAKQFKSLGKAEKKSRIKEMKRLIKNYKAEKRAGNEVSTDTLLLALLAIFIPPLAVYLHEGETNNRFWISVLLTILGYLLFGFAGVIFLGSLPGIIYALIVILGDM